MKLLFVVPGGVHPSGEIDVIPALLNIFRALSKEHQIYIIAMQQHHQLTEYRLFDCQVISLAMVKTSSLISAARLATKRLKHYGFKPDLVHSFWLGKPTVLGALLSRKFRVPLLATLGGGEGINMPQIHYGGSQTLIGRCLNMLSIKLADATTCGSHFVQSLSLKRWGIEPTVIPLGIDTEFWQQKKISPVVVKQWRLVQIASINPVKDPWLLLMIIDNLVKHGFDCQLDWIGQDTLNGEISRLAEKMGLAERVKFHGFKTQKQLRPLLQDKHFVVQTSHFESQGVAMAEAASQGLCPVGTDVGWLSDLGFGVAQARQSLAAAIAAQIFILTQNFAERLAKVEKAQNWIRHNNLDSTAARFNAQYHKITSS